MKDEESEWRNNQPGVVDQDGNGCIDQDQDETTDMDDSIILGCHILDISIAVSCLWICANYIRVFNFFQTYYDKYVKPMDQVPSAVLTGQPGIGESSCIASLA